MDLIDCPAYIVLDIPSPMAEKIRALRERFDAARRLLPAEVTLTGSCGVGLISPGQTVSEIQSALASAAERIHPFSASFHSVDRFPGTDIYYLTFVEEEPFFAAHRTVAGCGIRFEPSPYPYKPHCTIKLRKPPENEQELLDLFFLNIPHGCFRLDTLSVYALPDSNSCELIHKIELA